MCLDGKWTEWSELRACAGCDAHGNNGSKTLTRTCTQPSPKHNGSACSLSPTGVDATGPDGIQTETANIPCNCPVGKNTLFLYT